MYVGVDFLIDKNTNLYLSEVNIGLPGGAQEYDYVYQVKHKKPSKVFQYIENLCIRKFKMSFSDYLKALPYFNDLRSLKIWIDGYGNLPKNFPSILRLEDKWVQYLILSPYYPIITTELLDNKFIIDSSLFKSYSEFAIKKRLGRGGRGFIKVSNYDYLKNYNELKNYNNIYDGSYIIQPYIDSSININSKIFRFSIRALAFLGKFICMYANLSNKLVSNHGVLFYVNTDPNSTNISINKVDYKTVKFHQKAWEADLFYEESIPEYLYHNLYEDDVAEADFILPEKIFNKIKEISASVSSYYQELDYNKLPKSFIETNFF